MALVMLKCKMCPHTESEDNRSDAIQMMGFHMTSDHGGGGESQQPKVDRLKLEEGSTEATWRTFVQDWERYKESLDITAIKMI